MPTVRFPYTDQGVAAAEQAGEQARMMGQPQMQAPQMQPAPDAAWRLLWDLQMDEALRARAMADRPEMMQQIVEPLRGFRTPRGMDVAESRPSYGPGAYGEARRLQEEGRGIQGPLTHEMIQSKQGQAGLSTPVPMGQGLVHSTQQLLRKLISGQ